MEKFKTPKGTLEWVIISGEGKENLSGKLQYTANLVLTPETDPQHQAFIEKVEDFWEANKPDKFTGKCKSNGIYAYKEKNADGEFVEVPGKFYVALKTGTTYASGEAKVVKVFNSKAAEVQLGKQKIANGSVGYLYGAMDIYKNVNPKKKDQILEAGVTLYLDAVQLTKFVPYAGGVEAEADAEEGGWDCSDLNDSGIEPEAPAAESQAKPRL